MADHNNGSELEDKTSGSPEPESSEKASRGVSCEYCSIVFPKTSNYYMHANAFHKEKVAEFWIVCSKCNFYFPSETSLKNHDVQKHRIKPEIGLVSCTFCDDTFESENSFVRHANAEHKDSISDFWFACSDCSMYLPTAQGLSLHQKFVHRVSIANPEKKPTSDSLKSFSSEPRKLLGTPSVQIVRITKSEEDLKSEEITPEIDPLSFISCSYDEEPESKKPKLEEESRPNFRCRFCDKGFGAVSSLNRHIRNIHEKAENYTCLKCTQNFKDVAGLKNHTCPPIKPEHDEDESDDSTGGHEDFSVTDFLEIEQDEPVDPNDEDHVETFENVSAIHDPLFFPVRKRGRPVTASNKPNKCDICKKTFASRRGLNKHKRGVKCHLKLGITQEPKPPKPIGPAIPQCEKCHKIFSTRKGLLKHWRGVNCVARIQRKTIATLKIEYDEDGNIIETGNKPQCDLCKKTFTTRKSLKIHKKRVKCLENLDKDESIFTNKCPHCEKSFKTEKYLNFHIEGSHMEIDFECDICQKKFANRDTLKRHFDVVHNMNKNFECNECGRKYRTKPELSRHSIKYNHSCLFECEKCQDSFPSYVLYLKHVRSDKHSKVDRACKLCSKSFSNSKTLNRHIRRVHEDEKNFECDQCGRAFLLKHELGHHCAQTGHSSFFGCDKCPEEDLFASYDLYKEHMNVVHNKGKGKSQISEAESSVEVDEDGAPVPVECQECGKIFSTKSARKKHIKNVHLEIRDHVCDICEKGFTDNSRLQAHIQSVHYKVRNFACDICGKSLSERSKLKNHIAALHPEALDDYLATANEGSSHAPMTSQGFQGRQEEDDEDEFNDEEDFDDDVDNDDDDVDNDDDDNDDVDDDDDDESGSPDSLPLEQELFEGSPDPIAVKEEIEDD